MFGEVKEVLIKLKGVLKRFRAFSRAEVYFKNPFPLPKGGLRNLFPLPKEDPTTNLKILNGNIEKQISI